jgi:hypothetical protein
MDNGYHARLVRTVTTVVGKVPVDAECTAMLSKAHVYCEKDDIFDCMLNQVRTSEKNFVCTCLLNFRPMWETITTSFT